MATAGSRRVTCAKKSTKQRAKTSRQNIVPESLAETSPLPARCSRKCLADDRGGGCTPCCGEEAMLRSSTHCVEEIADGVRRESLMRSSA
jgi:hypothetical protein